MNLKGKKLVGRHFSGVFRFTVAALAIALSFTYSIFGTTDIVMAVSCSSNASTEAACEVLEEKGEAEDCDDRSGNVGAMWLSETSDGDSETINPSQTSGNITAYLRGAFVSDGCNGTGPLHANRIQIQYGYGKRQSKGTEIPYITGEGGETLNRGTSAGGYGDWSDSDDSIAVTINLDSLRNDTDHVSFSDGVYVLKGSIYRCPVGVTENSDNCWGDPFKIKIKLPPKYRIRKFTYYKDETKTNTGTDTNTYSASSTATITSNGSSPTNSSGTYIGSNNRVPTNGEASSTGGTATMTLYDRIRKSVKIGFVENITKSSGPVSSSSTFKSGVSFLAANYTVTGTTATTLSGTTSGNRASYSTNTVYQSAHNYSVSPGGSVSKCQSMTYSPTVSYNYEQKRTVTHKYTRVVIQTDTDGDGDADEGDTRASITAEGYYFKKNSSGSWTGISTPSGCGWTTSLSATCQSKVSAHAETTNSTWPKYSCGTASSWSGCAKTYTSATPSTQTGSVSSCATIDHPYVYWQVSHDIKGRQDAKTTAPSTITSDPGNLFSSTVLYKADGTTVDYTNANYWDKTSLKDYYSRSNNFATSYPSRLKRDAAATKTLTSLSGRTKAGSSDTDYLNAQTSYNASLLQQADTLYTQYSFKNSSGSSSPDGNNGRTDADILYRRALYGISTYANYGKNSGSTGYASLSTNDTSVLAHNISSGNSGSGVSSGDKLEIVKHYSNFSTSNTTNCDNDDHCSGAHPSTTRTNSDQIYIRNRSGHAGIIDNGSINAQSNDIQFGPYTSLNAGQYVVYYSGTRLQNCLFDYTSNGDTSPTVINKILLANNGTRASFNFTINSNITNGKLEFRCHSHDNDVRVTSITIAKYVSDTTTNSSRTSLTLGHSLKYWRELYHDTNITIEHGSDGTNRLVSRTTSVPASISSTPRTGSTTKSHAAIYAHFPYNYRTETSTTLSNDLTPGGSATAKFTFKINRRTNPLVLSSGSYRTSTRSDMKLQGAIFYVPASTTTSQISDAIKASVDKTRTDTLCGAISATSTHFQNCNVVSWDDSGHKDGKTYSGNNSNDYSSTKTHNFVVPDVSNANIGVKICAVSGISYADSHNYPNNNVNQGASSSLRSYSSNHGTTSFGSNDWSVDNWTDNTPTNNPNWRISNVVCQPITVRPSFQVWNGNFFTNGSTHTSLTTKNPPGLNISDSGVPENFNETSSDGVHYYGSWAEYALLVGQTGQGIASGSHLGYPNGSTSNNYCTNSPMSIANYGNSTIMADLACFTSGDKNKVGKSSITADPSKFLEQIKARYIDRRSSSEVPADTKIVYRSGNVNLSSLASIKIKSFNKTNAATDDDFDTYVYIVNGTLTINQNLCTASTTCNGNLVLTNRNSTGISSYDQIPQVIIIARNINVKASVTQIDAWLIATGDGDSNSPIASTLNANGQIDTCSDYATTALKSNRCTNTLLFNGPVLASKVILDRTNVQNGLAQSGATVSTANLSSDFGSATAAEIFNLRPDTYLWAYRQATKYEYATTVYTKELAPRL